jgi:ferrochelatase
LREDQQVTYDALLLLSFGGPESPADVVPFLERVTAGRGIPAERLQEVGAHYYEFGGRSPLNDQNRELLAAIRQRLLERGVEVPVFWGNRNWHPFVADALREMSVAGIANAAVFATSAYSSYSGCRQYQEDLSGAAAQLRTEGMTPPQLTKLPPYWDRDGFVSPQVDAVVEACTQLRETNGVVDPRLVFTTHSIPASAAATSGPAGAGGAYVAQHRAVAGRIAAAASERLGAQIEWELVFQSRSGPPSVPWLEPDISDRLRELSAAGGAGVVIVPIGFTSDHIEVLWDLDRVALGVSAEVGMSALRAATVGTDPRYVDMIIDLMREPARPCPVGCCAPPQRLGARP